MGVDSAKTLKIDVTLPRYSGEDNMAPNLLWIQADGPAAPVEEWRFTSGPWRWIAHV
jgi:hypothetical protein